MKTGKEKETSNASMLLITAVEPGEIILSFNDQTEPTIKLLK
jgi:hypothetical protein